MGIINPENPFGNGGRSARLREIKSARTSGIITDSQYDSLIRDENTTGNYIGLKRGALAAILLMVGFLLVISSV